MGAKDNKSKAKEDKKPNAIIRSYNKEIPIYLETRVSEKEPDKILV